MLSSFYVHITLYIIWTESVENEEVHCMYLITENNQRKDEKMDWTCNEKQ